MILHNADTPIAKVINGNLVNNQLRRGYDLSPVYGSYIWSSRDGYHDHADQRVHPDLNSSNFLKKSNPQPSPSAQPAAVNTKVNPIQAS